MSPLLDSLGNVKVVLASSSPQRKKLLEQIGLKFQVFPSPFDEEAVSKESFKNPKDYVNFLAHEKALAVAQQLSKDETNCIVIGADTVILHDDRIIGKPHTPDVARATLQQLNNTSHIVCTGVAMIKAASLSSTHFMEETRVQFGDLSAQDISSYVESGEPLNKAGAYGIQGLGAMLVESIAGDYNNVVGFPLHRFRKEIIKFIKSDVK